MKRVWLFPLAGLAAGAECLAQVTRVDPAHKFCWAENVGWINWADAGDPPGSQGARIYPTFLAGFVWGENIGWISLGDGTPGLVDRYANIESGDFGVNIEASSGDLFGLGWGENIGWVNFDTRAALGPFGRQARLDITARRLRGYAWGENIGWINLDDSAVYVGLDCPGDFNGSGVVSVQDIFDFLAAYFTGDPRADFNGSGIVSVQDIFDFLAAYFAGCR